jgi:hypothetical protein
MSDPEASPEDLLLTKAFVAAATLADTCGALREFESEIGRNPVGHLVHYLSTEFWDHGFSQAEIRAAFEAALDELDRYAIGVEKRA